MRIICDIKTLFYTFRNILRGHNTLVTGHKYVLTSGFGEGDEPEIEVLTCKVCGAESVGFYAD